jgi:hypothetical protein
MKLFSLSVILLLSSTLSACKPAQEAQDTVKEGLKVTTDQIDKAKILSDLTLITGAMLTYQMQNEGKNPASIKELKLDLNYPQDLDYDPKTGQVRSKTFPDL